MVEEESKKKTTKKSSSGKTNEVIMPRDKNKTILAALGLLLILIILGVVYTTRSSDSLVEEDQSLYGSAQEARDAFDFDVAQELFRKEVDAASEEDKPFLYFKLAETQLVVDEFEKAKENFQKASDLYNSLGLKEAANNAAFYARIAAEQLQAREIETQNEE